MIKTTEIAWLGGLLEGEGCFIKGSTSACPRIALQIGDKDVIDKAAKYLGCRVTVNREATATTKKMLVCSIHGHKAASWMMTLYSFLGERRRQAIKELLPKWYSAYGRPRIRNKVCLVHGSSGIVEHSDGPKARLHGSKRNRFRCKHCINEYARGKRNRAKLRKLPYYDRDVKGEN